MAMSVGTVVGYLDLDTSKFQNGLKTATQQLKGLTDSSKTTSDKFTSLGSGLKTLGQNMSTYVTLPLAGIGAASVKTAADFEKSMSNVSALSGATGKDLEDLENIAKEMGATTQFSASEAADALGFMALAGWDTQQSIGALPGVLDLAASSGMGLADASDMVTDYLSAFGEEADQAGRMADVLSYAQANSNTTSQALGEAFKNCAVNANAFGLDIEQTTALLGKLGDQGLKGSEAGTALNAVFRDMSSKMKDGAIAIGDTNVKITDANGNFKSMAEIIAGVEKATDGLSESEKMVALQSTFTADSIKAMGIFMNTGASDIEAFTNELYNSEGAASDMAATMNDNLNGQLTALGSALEGAGISIGNALLPVIKQLVEWIQNLVTWFNNLSPGIQTAITIFGLVVAAIGPVLLIVGQLCTAIGGLITFFGAGGVGAGILSAAIGALSGPVGIVIGVITALIAIGTLLYQNWDVIKAKCTEIWGYVSDWISKTWESIKSSTTETWNSIKDALSSVWENIKSAISEPVEYIKSLIEITWNFISSTTSSIWNSIKGIIQSVWGLIKAVIDLNVAAIKLVIQAAWNVIKTVTTTVWNAIKSVIQTVWNAIKPFVTTAVNAIKNVITTVFNAIKSFIQTVVNGWKNIITTVWNAIKNVVSTGANAVRNTVRSVFSTIQNILTAPFKAAQSVISGILGGITRAINSVTSGIKKVTSMFKMVEAPGQEDQEIQAYTDTDYKQARFDYNRAKQTTVSDVIASNYSMLESFKGFENFIKNSNKEKEVNTNTENIFNINLNIDKMVNSDNKSIEQIANELAFYMKRKRISLGGA